MKLASERYGVGIDLFVTSSYCIGHAGFRFKIVWLQNSRGLSKMPFWVTSNFGGIEMKPQLTVVEVGQL